MADDPACKELAIDIAEKAANSKDASVQYIASYAKLVYKSHGKEEAIRILDEALRKYANESEESKDYRELKALKNKIENSWLAWSEEHRA